MQSLNQINGKYPRLFEQDNEGDSGEGEPIKQGGLAAWGWYNVLDSLSNSDRTKWDYFLNMGVIEFLNTLAYFKDKEKHLEQLRNKLNRGTKY